MHLLVPEGRMLEAVCSALGSTLLAVGEHLSRASLIVHALPFTDQDGYDELLWACDINFVRGEDSFVRAQWAGRPFVWHIYPQDENAHRPKLEAFMERYAARLDPQAAAELKLIEGFDDGTFRPDDYITRAQACAIINRTLGRVPDADDDNFFD